MNKTQLLIDSHVHIQDCYNIKKYFLAVFENFNFAADKNNLSENWIGILFLTEVQELNYFSKLLSEEIKEELGKAKFEITRTSESESLIISNSHGKKVIIIAGKQIIAKNNIEVLALGTTADIQDGLDVKTTIEKVNKLGAISVLPWGVGKWLGKRKEIIHNYIKENNTETFFLGDNSGRPSFWPNPEIFKIGNSLNHFVFPGSDALAIPSEVNKTGSYGFFLESEIDIEYPAKHLKKTLFELKIQPSFFGKLENPFKFFINQIKMQLKKHIS